MKQNLSVKRWREDIAMEEVSMHLVSFRVQMKAIPSYLCSEENINRLASKCGELLELEDMARARGFLRVIIMVDTTKPLTTGCWVTKAGDK